MTGSPAYEILPTESFVTSLREFFRAHYNKKDKKNQDALIVVLDGVRDLLALNPRPIPASRLEGWPHMPTTAESDRYELRKLSFVPPGLTGSAGEGRLLYLVCKTERVISLIGVYTHKQWAKRPDDRTLKELVLEAVEHHRRSGQQKAAAPAAALNEGQGES